MDDNKNIVIDTCSIMNNNSVIEGLLAKNYKVIISIVTVEELDNLKTSRDYSKSKDARHAIRAIENNKSNITFDLSRDSCLQEVNTNITNTINDDIIVSCAKRQNAYILTDDLNVKIKAESIGVPCYEYGRYDFYKGYIWYAFTEEEFNDYWEHRSDYFPTYHINEYIIIETISTGKTVEYRYNGEDLVPLKLPPSRFIKAKNALQRCALDMLNNPEITIAAVLGSYGSGKTMLSMQMALYHVQEKGNQSKILGIREVVGEGKEIGYLPGSMEDKVGNYFAPLAQSLSGGEFELEHLKMSGTLEVQIPYYLKGTTYNSTIAVVDECEDLTEAQIRLVGTRLGENSRVFFAGDYKQSVINKSASNPAVKMCNELKGNPKFACIYLGEDVRSETSKIFSELFEKD